MKKAIIVEDSESIRSRLKDELERKSDFLVLTAEDGLLGLELIKKNLDCIVIITDLHMPNMTGFEMLEELKKEKLCIDTPKIILTSESFYEGDNADKLQERGKELGVKTWVPKAANEDAFTIIHNVVDRVAKKHNKSS